MVVPTAKVAAVQAAYVLMDQQATLAKAVAMLERAAAEGAKSVRFAEVDVRVKKRIKRNGRIDELGEVAIQFGSLEALNGLIERLRG